MTMQDQGWQAEQFERCRARLHAVALRMLGSGSEADDAVQEAWLRLSRPREQEIDNIEAWLTTVIGRVCVDLLRARYARREQLVGTWLPEPTIRVESDAGHDRPEEQSLLADSVGLALLVVLETLSPDERLAFVLHDMFAVPFDQIAPMIDRTPEAARQLASRARRRVRGSARLPDPDLARQRRVVDAFLDAARAGDFDRLVGLLHPDVAFRADSIRVPATVTGADAVAREVVAQGSRFAKLCRPALVDGVAGVLVQGRRGPLGVVSMTIVEGRIADIDLVTDRQRLARLRIVQGTA